jgi:cysteine desulfurase
MRRVYLDHSATTPVRPEVLQAMLPYFSDKAGNASSLHEFGQEAKRALEQSRETVARVLRADPQEIYFTSGGTEGDNQAIIGTAYARRERGKHLITSAIEHHAVLYTCEWLGTQGYEVTYLPVDRYGVVSLEVLERSIRPDTTLISVMLANNEVGTIEPIAEIAQLAAKHDILMHTDAVQAAGKLPVRVGELGVDMLSLTAHKFGGPKGVGVLYVRRGVTLQSLLHGGHHEGGLRPGTQNVAGAVGLATALRLADQELPTEPARLARLRDRFQADILAQIPQTQINGHPTARLGNILNVSFIGLEGEALLMSLDAKGVAVSTGSACAAGSTDPSHVLRAMKLDPLAAQGALRFSLGHTTTEEDMEYAFKTLVEVTERLQAVSPLFPACNNASVAS